MHHHHRGGSGSGVPAAPPPPLLSSRSRVSGSRPSARSRSRSRSPGRSGSGKYHGGAGRGDRERDSRDLRERVDRERERERRRSASPYGSSSRNERDRDRKPSASSSNKPSSSLEGLPSISLIQAEPPSIIRRILNPEDVKIPRRVHEGSKPIFDREELREAMLRRMKANDNEENPPQANVYIQEPSVTQQRVVAIIREPVGADLYLASKDPAFQHHAVMATSGKTTVGATSILQRLSPERSFRRSLSPPPSRNIRQGARAPVPPPPALSAQARIAERERERERLLLDRERERDREQIQRAIEREREQLGRAGRGERERERDRGLHPERERDLLHEIRGGDRDRDHPRDQREKSRFDRPPGAPQHPLDRLEPNRARSRSPISRIPREDLRLRRRSRSHSVTPPPMPEEIRRQLIERQRNIDLRNSLSRRPAKFMMEDDRAKGDRGLPMRGGGRGRGGFTTRTGRGRDEGRVWVHDMYEGDDEPKKGD